MPFFKFHPCCQPSSDDLAEQPVHRGCNRNRPTFGNVSGAVSFQEKDCSTSFHRVGLDLLGQYWMGNADAVFSYGFRIGPNMTGQLPPVAAKQTLEAFESCDAGVGLFLGTVDRLVLGSSCRITARCKKLVESATESTTYQLRFHSQLLLQPGWNRSTEWLYNLSQMKFKRSCGVKYLWKYSTGRRTGGTSSSDSKRMYGSITYPQTRDKRSNSSSESVKRHKVVPLDAGLDRTIFTGSVFITQDNSIYIHNDGHSGPTTLRYQLTFTRPSLQR
ncbi:hypothetical protein T07_3955 [Trichinella nelsoni]|uniref:Uncharacterized protein n=1 Tax=Trichinella nelsoni TaxID=6336 RepID=A0A0V0SMU2_9BILA|nr:hypothetical protein T07_3955 [Trichinella nelsoni]